MCACLVYIIVSRTTILWCPLFYLFVLAYQYTVGLLLLLLLSSCVRHVRGGVHGLLKLPCICDVLLLLYIVLYMHTRYIIYVHRSRTYSISIYSSSRSSIYAVQMVTTIGGSGIAHLVSLRSQLVLLDVREFLNYGHHQISGVSFLKVSGALCKKI